MTQECTAPKTTRCTTCATEFTDAEIVGHSACPSCKSPGVPMAIAQDVTLKINWHELRILTIWASNFAGSKDFPAPSRAALNAIIRRLEAQRPNETFAPLTLFGEVRQLQDAGFDAEMRDGEGNVVVPRRTKH